MWNGQVHGADGRDSIAGWQKTTAGVRGAAEGAGLVSGVMAVILLLFRKRWDLEKCALCGLL